MNNDNEFRLPTAPPSPPLFINEPERNFQKNIVDEINERVIGQQILYHAIDIDNSNFHPLYGECIEKTFLPPIRIYALITWEGFKTTTTEFGIEQRPSIIIKFHHRRLTEDQDTEIRQGDYVRYGDVYYEIVKLDFPKKIWGQVDHECEVDAICIKAREGSFNAK